MQYNSYKKKGAIRDFSSLASKIKILENNVKNAQKRKIEIVGKLLEFSQRYKDESITYAEYEYLVNHYLKGKPLKFWENYYEEYAEKAASAIKDYKDKLKYGKLEKKVKAKKHYRNPIPLGTSAGELKFGLILAMFVCGFFFLNSFTGFTVYDTVEFAMNNSWNLNESYVRVSFMGEVIDNPIEEFVINSSIVVDMSMFNLSGDGFAYVDLVVGGKIIDSSKVEVGDYDESLEVNESFIGENLTDWDLVIVNDTFVNDTFVNDTFVNETFVNETFVNDTFVNDTFVNDTFVNETFVNETFVNETFVNETFVNETFVNDTFVNETFVNDTFVNETFVNETFVNDTFVNETFVNETFVNETFVNETLVNETLVNDTFVNESFYGMNLTNWTEKAVIVNDTFLEEIVQNATEISLTRIEKLLSKKLTKGITIGRIERFNRSLSLIERLKWNLKGRWLNKITAFDNVEFNMNSSFGKGSVRLTNTFADEITHVGINEISSLALNNESVKFGTPVFAMNLSIVEEALVVLPKTKDINMIVVCDDYNYGAMACSGEWKDSGLPFEQNLTHAWFTTDHFSAYGGVSIEILNVQSYPMVGGEWTVRFNATGTANLTIKAIEGTTYTEEQNDNSITEDDLAIVEVKCGKDVLYNKEKNIFSENMYFRANGELKKPSELQSEKIESIVFLNYSCDDIGYHIVKVLTSGKHVQEFMFGDETAEAENWCVANNSKTLYIPTYGVNGLRHDHGSFYCNTTNTNNALLQTDRAGGSADYVVGMVFEISKLQLGKVGDVELCFYATNANNGNSPFFVANVSVSTSPCADPGDISSIDSRWTKNMGGVSSAGSWSCAPVTDYVHNALKLGNSIVHLRVYGEDVQKASTPFVALMPPVALGNCGGSSPAGFSNCTPFLKAKVSNKTVYKKRFYPSQFMAKYNGANHNTVGYIGSHNNNKMYTLIDFADSSNEMSYIENQSILSARTYYYSYSDSAKDWDDTTAVVRKITQGWVEADLIETDLSDLPSDDSVINDRII
ncbi:MAG: hypothetical protein U9Q69_01260, partial [Nanoarchaeota archaeon]|nr:hypothetical protein [Nanoarchaeota archaeon]